MLQCHIYDVLCYCNDVAAKYKPQNVPNHMPLKVKRYAHTVYFENVLIYHSIFMSHDKKSSILRIALCCIVVCCIPATLCIWYLSLKVTGLPMISLYEGLCRF